VAAFVIIPNACSNRSEENNSAPITQENRSLVTASQPPPVESTPLRAPTPGPTPVDPRTIFPRKVIAAKDLNPKLEYGVLGIKRGQPFLLQGRIPEGYKATYGSINFTANTGDFQEVPATVPAP